jgi:hypothetical protein
MSALFPDKMNTKDNESYRAGLKPDWQFSPSRSPDMFPNMCPRSRLRNRSCPDASTEIHRWQPRVAFPLCVQFRWRCARTFMPGQRILAVLTKQTAVAVQRISAANCRPAASARLAFRRMTARPSPGRQTPADALSPPLIEPLCHDAVFLRPRLPSFSQTRLRPSARPIRQFRRNSRRRKNVLGGQPDNQKEF